MGGASGTDFLTGLAVAYQALTRLSDVASAIVWSRALLQAEHDRRNLSFAFLFSLPRTHEAGQGGAIVDIPGWRRLGQTPRLSMQIPPST
jgi:hypothetical protein